MKTTATVIIFLVFYICNIFAQDSLIEYNSQRLFLNGANLGWVNFAEDIGPGETNFTEFGRVFKEAHEWGANSIRLWLHTNGTNTPEFLNDTVIGPGEGAIDDLKQILDSAYYYDIGLILCLWSFDMQRTTIGEPYLSQNQALLTDTNLINEYINNALIPMVDSLKTHPGIIAWEIFNEPEGMCSDIPNGGGWSFTQHVSITDVQTFVNKCAGAIHRVDTNLMVTNGSWELLALSDIAGTNYYTDANLISAGGDTDGTLDFYTVHYYDHLKNNPFENNYSYWNLDKPLVIAEFYPSPSCNDCGDFSNYENLYLNGYAGAMGWRWFGEEKNLIKTEMQYMFAKQTTDVDIDNNIGDSPILAVTSPEYGDIYDPGDTVYFDIDVSDTDGNIDSVSYYIDVIAGEDSLISVVKIEPFDALWINPTENTYKVYVVATDNEGYTKQSSLIEIQIGDPPISKYEAEEATRSGSAAVKDDTKASGGECVTFGQEGYIEWDIFDVPADDTYPVIFAYRLLFSDKRQNIIVNDGDALSHNFTGVVNEWLLDTLNLDLTEGTSTIQIEADWGWMDFDYIDFPFDRPPFVSEITVLSQSGLTEINTLGGTLQLTASILPLEAYIQDVTWSVNFPDVASIDQNGLLTAHNDGIVTVKATAADGSGVEGSITIEISNQSVDINLTYKDELLIYPNPTKGTIHFNNYNCKVELYSMLGTLVRSEHVFNGIIDINDLPNGVYQMKIDNRIVKILKK